MTAPADNCLVKSTPHSGGTNNFPPLLNLSNRSFSGKHKRTEDNLALKGGHICCPQSSSSSWTAFSGAFAQIQLTKGCIPRSEWGTWFAGTWNGLHTIHMDPCFWTVPLLFGPLFQDKRSLWWRNTEISCDIYSTSPCWQLQRVPLPDYEVNILSTCGHLPQISPWITANSVLFQSWNLWRGANLRWSCAKSGHVIQSKQIWLCSRHMSLEI